MNREERFKIKITIIPVLMMSFGILILLKVFMGMFFVEGIEFIKYHQDSYSSMFYSFLLIITGMSSTMVMVNLYDEDTFGWKTTHKTSKEKK